MKKYLVLTIILLASTALHAQEFEVASIRVNKTDNSGVEGRRISIQATPGSLNMRNVTLLSCIRWAYNVRDFQISGGPDWRDSERYDIVAKPAAASSEDQLRLMLRALLANRFKLTVRQDTRELPVYVMSVGKNGPRMQRSKTDLEGAFDFTLVLFDTQLNGDTAATKAAVAGTSPSTYADALERIGLKLESQKLPLDHITIQNAQKPSEN